LIVLYCKSESAAVLVFQTTSAEEDVSAVVYTSVIFGARDGGAAESDTPDTSSDIMTAMPNLVALWVIVPSSMSYVWYFRNASDRWRTNRKLRARIN
jgi:hypothetical protein